MFQASAILPSLIRAMHMPVKSTLLPVGAVVNPTPEWVPLTLRAHHDPVAIHQRILDDDMEVREGCAELMKHRLELIWAAD